MSTFTIWLIINKTYKRKQSCGVVFKKSVFQFKHLYKVKVNVHDFKTRQHFQGDEVKDTLLRMRQK